MWPPVAPTFCSIVPLLICFLANMTQPSMILTIASKKQKKTSPNTSILGDLLIQSYTTSKKPSMSTQSACPWIRAMRRVWWRGPSAASWWVTWMADSVIWKIFSRVSLMMLVCTFGSETYSMRVGHIMMPSRPTWKYDNLQGYMKWSAGAWCEQQKFLPFDKISKNLPKFTQITHKKSRWIL